MANDSVKFRSSMGGYNKSDVNEYIIKMNREFRESEDESARKIAEAEEKAKAAESALDEARLACDARIAELDSEIAELKTKAAELEAALEKAKAEPRDDPKTVSEHIGSLMITANTAAESIKENAKSEAGRIIDEAKNEADEIKRRMNEKAEAALASLAYEIRGALDGSVSETLASISEIRSEANDLAMRVNTKKSEINDKLDYFARETAEEIKKKISSLSLFDGN